MESERTRLCDDSSLLGFVLPFALANDRQNELVVAIQKLLPSGSLPVVISNTRRTVHYCEFTDIKALQKHLQELPDDKLMILATKNEYLKIKIMPREKNCVRISSMHS